MGKAVKTTYLCSQHHELGYKHGNEGTLGERRHHMSVVMMMLVLP